MQAQCELEVDNGSRAAVNVYCCHSRLEPFNLRTPGKLCRNGPVKRIIPFYHLSGEPVWPSGKALGW